MAIPTTFPDWCLTPPAQSSLNEQQTIGFVGTPVSGSYVLNLGTAGTAPIFYNDPLATIQSKINAIYAPATAVVTGGPAPANIIVDFGNFSQTNLIAQMTITNNTMLTSGGAQVIPSCNITQASQEPATVAIDTAHTNNGWSLFEFPPFNMFNQFMNLVGLWIRWFALVTGNAQVYWGGTGTGQFPVALTIANFPINANIVNGTVVNFNVGTFSANYGSNNFTVGINGGSGLNVLDKYGNQLILGNDILPGQTIKMVYNSGSFYCPDLTASTSNPRTLYGGTDTGSANHYILTTGLFPVDQPAGGQTIPNGTVLYFIPAHSNTTDSNLSLDSGNTILILQPSGSALTTGMLVAGTIAQIVLMPDGWYLMNPQ